jgi:hypothetical protein
VIRHHFGKVEIAGLIPARGTISIYVPVAQLVERDLEAIGVAGSSPARCTTFIHRLGSSVGSSSGLKIRVSLVQFQPGAPIFHLCKH